MTTAPMFEDGSTTRYATMAVCVLACLIPAASQAETTSGHSSAGIYYEVSGAGEPVVLMHGFSLDRRMWKREIQAFETRFRVVRYDLRAHGASAPISSEYSPVDDLRSVLDALNLERAALVGLSAGAEVAIDFALVYPDRVSRLVLASPGLGGYVPATRQPWLQPIFEAAAAGDPDRAATLWAQAPLMRVHAGPDAAAEIRSVVLDNAKLWSYKTNPARRPKPPAIERLNEISVATLIVLGGRDQPDTAAVARLLARDIRGARLLTLADAGHLVNIDASDEFERATARFLAHEESSSN